MGAEIEFIAVTGLSITLSILIWARKKGLGNKYLLEAGGWLPIALMPSASSVALLAKPLSNIEWFFAVYFVSVIIWFLIVTLYVLNEKAEKEKARDAYKWLFIMMMFLIFLGVLLFWEVQTILTIHKENP